jgi:hypothetical protein
MLIVMFIPQLPNAVVPVHFDTPSHVNASDPVEAHMHGKGGVFGHVQLACRVLGMLTPLQQGDCGPHGPGVGFEFMDPSVSNGPGGFSQTPYPSSIHNFNFHDLTFCRPGVRRTEEKLHASRKSPSSIQHLSAASAYRA